MACSLVVLEVSVLACSRCLTTLKLIALCHSYYMILLLGS